MAISLENNFEIDDLTFLSGTIPSKKDDEIERDFIIKNIEQTFNNSNNIIMIEGLGATGKTTLLSQFARKHKSNCISFFIGEDYWKSNISYFLTELCLQMEAVCSPALKKRLEGYDIEDLADRDLKQLFSRLYSDLVRQSKNSGSIFYFVVDGLDKISTENKEESILKYIPLGDEGVYILLSSEKGHSYEFTYSPLQIPFFSRPEVNMLLSKYLSEDDINTVYIASDGMPGYINEILRQLKITDNIKDVINNLPSSFKRLLEKNWSQYDSTDIDFTDLLSLLAFSPEKLLKDDVIKIIKISNNQLEAYIEQTSFLFVNEGYLELLSPYKNFLKEKLEENKIYITQKMIKFYEINSEQTSSVVYLPRLYQENQDYDALVNLIDTTYLRNTLKTTQQISLVRENLNILSSMTYKNKDWQLLSWTILTDSVFTEIVHTTPKIESQIKALLSLDSYEEALKLAYLCELPEDRLILLSHICRFMKKAGIDISKDLIKSIEESINLIDNTVGLSEQLINKLLNICSNLFSINAALSLKLLERVVEKTGDNVKKDKLMDYLLVRLLFRVDDEDEGVNQLKDRIGDYELQDLLKITNDIEEENYEEVINQVKNISDTSAKLFYLSNWCMKNKSNKNIITVVDYALQIMTESDEYTPTLKLLKQFSEVLTKSTEYDKISKLIEKIENLKFTILKNPFVDYANLELVLSKIENNWSTDLAEERFYKIYFELDEIQDEDTKCLVLIYLIEAQSELFSDDHQLFSDLKDQLVVSYNKLLTASADHYKITKKILSKLTEFDKSLAFRFAQKLNTKQRRFKAYQEIIDTHSKNQNIDFNFVLDILEEIDDKRHKDWVFVRFLKNCVVSNAPAPNDIKGKIFGIVKNIRSNIGKTLAFGHYLNIISGDENKSQAAFNELIISLQKIDKQSDKKDIGYRIVQILSESHRDLAIELYEKINKEYDQEGNIFDTRLHDVFTKVTEMLIRMIPDILKSEDYRFKINYIKSSIASIPSSHEQCKLLTSLALRCEANGKNEYIGEISEKCFDILETVDDPETYSKIIIDIAPLLYIYEENILFEKLENVNSIFLHDEAIANTIQYILTKRPSEDPIDGKSSLHKVNYPEALNICNLIGKVTNDVNIYYLISCLVDAMIEPTSNNSYKSLLREKQLLTITQKLVQIINNKLPDNLNIKHNGYKIACFGYLTKLRDTSSNKATERWETLFPSRNELKRSATNINNISDRIFVLTTLGGAWHKTNPDLGITCIREAEKHLNEINNLTDRVSKYETVAESYQDTSNKKAAKFVIEEAMRIVKNCSSEEGRDQLLGGLIDLAHTINPELAQSFASSIDSSDSLINLNEKLITLNLHSDPKKVENYKNKETNRVLNELYTKMMRTICSGKGSSQHDEVIGQYINLSLGNRFETIILGLSWYIENKIISFKNHTQSTLNDLFMTSLQLLDLIRSVEVSLYDNKSTNQEVGMYKLLSQTSVFTFGLEEQKEAYDFIKNWISENAKNYLKIYDPYFNEEMLGFIKSIVSDCRVFIYTSIKTNELENLPERYNSYWYDICDQVPPETHFHIYSTKSGNTPLHDRFIIGEKSGLNLGTSLSGLGSKFSTIKVLDIEEKEKIETEIIGPLTTMPPTEYKQEKLLMKVFSL
ncbi:ATP-binding protein [Gracilibacillus dipsosauri]|uniref:Nephrocystin 3-like N-terminal domain-containing protein n=1 Tax=Gracilibacillus dipsosauri TaxID=178340 RepID=A0A317L3M9_9BACI|nr:ATP-binding protein [Gracilibacillus dipsosauri]PWU70437.1 hypothetical protein DLJ74_00980 [Gracilibacillus dipsosauri]